ncbi:MAG: protease modulator HflK, partial [Thermoanaerobaculia bacterium]|nr:protease modulator HflK [Thermoanaerobaculia bacterium]
MADDTIIDFPKKLQNLPLGSFGTLLLILLAAVMLISSVYTVDPEEVGVVLRFGEFVKTTEPGLHFKIPLGIDQVMKVARERQLKLEFGFRTVEAGVRSTFRQVEDEALMLTGDLNTAVVEWVVQYRIEDPEKYLFRVRNVTDTLRDISEAVMREVVGDRTVNEVLTVGRQEIADLVEQRIQALCEEYETGIAIDQVVLQDVNPPDA